MKNSKHKIVTLVSVFLLLSLATIFIHSELGIANEQKGHHEDHDFCDLIANSTMHAPLIIKLFKIINLHPLSLAAGFRLFSPENLSYFVLITPSARFLNNASRLSFLNTLLI